MNLKKYSFIIILLFIFIFSMSAVYSQDFNQTDPKTFTDLNREIVNNQDLNITSDYYFNDKTDSNYTKGIVINKNITINGNNHAIDANGEARIFTLNASNIVINNLIIMNAKNYAISSLNSTITTNNVTFLNNTGDEEGGAIYIENTTYTSRNDAFINNYATRFGSAIYAESNSTLNIEKTKFESDRDLYWGLIYTSKSDLHIADTDFENIISNYTPVLFAENMKKIIIRNSSFKNLYAKVTGGSMGLKESKNIIIIDNCSFTNVSSIKNGGAIYIDANGVTSSEKCLVALNNTKFVNCSSGFGGAFVQLGGNLTIQNTEFFDNFAFYDGGAVYLSNVNTTMKNILFKNNLLNKSNYGGALFFDYGTLKIINVNFTANSNALYLFDSNYTLSNSKFEGNGYNVYSIFDRNARITNCNFIGGQNKINQTDYRYTFKANNTPIDYNPVVFDLSLVNSSYFDLRNEGLVSSVKKQGWSGTCWAFSTVAVLESALLKATNRTLNLDLSENNVRNVALKYNRYGSSSDEGGDAEQGGSYLVNWWGAVSEEDDSYDELGKVSPIFDDLNKYFIFKSVIIEPRFNITDNYKVKEALVKYGALGVAVLSPDRDTPNDFNKNTSAAYSNITHMTDHAVTLVGWDDNYSASNFKITPPGDGAWIIKNSWGEEWGDKGYYYASYYDNSAINYDTSIFAVIIDPSISYDKIYQYDTNARATHFQKLNGTIPIDMNYTQWELYNLKKNLTLPCNYSNTYEADGNDLISAIGTYFKYDDFKYTVWIYVNGKETYSQSGMPPHTGYDIIKLNKEIPVKKGDNFTIKIQSSSTPVVWGIRNKVKSNISYSNYSGLWEDLLLKEEIASIKVYTNPNNFKIEALNVTKYFLGNERFIVNVTDSLNNPVVNQSVNITINGVTYKRNTDNNGLASLALNLNPGYYNVTTSIDETFVNSSALILSTIDSSDLEKVFRNQSQYWATFVDSAGNYLAKGTSVQFNINGVLYDRKVNEKGSAKLNINLNPGKYIITAKNTVTGERSSNNITVLAKIAENNNLTKYYKNDSQYIVRLIGDDGNPVGANENVSFNINGVFYNRVTNEKGYAKLNINLAPGDYIITAEYKGCKVSNSMKVLATLTADDLTKSYGSSEQFIATLVDGHGKVFAGESVGFNINGVFYNRTTDSSGQAKLNINLMAGEYIITSSHNGLNISNKITVTV